MGRGGALLAFGATPLDWCAALPASAEPLHTALQLAHTRCHRPGRFCREDSKKHIAHVKTEVSSDHATCTQLTLPRAQA